MKDPSVIEVGEYESLEFRGLEDNEIAHSVANKQPLFLPWKRQYIRIGTCFQSQRQGSDHPWMDNDGPFMLSDLHMIPKILNKETGAEASYKSVHTSKQTETGDHLSLGFGVGVGLPFLASVNVKGTYDKHVQENKDADKYSIRASVRSGSVMLERQPRLSKEAMIMLKYGGGYDAFCEKYGDYFVAGLHLGGETGFLLSTSKFNKHKVEKFGVTVTVTVLFLEASKSWSKDFHDYSSGKTLSLLGYDTLSQKNWNITTNTAGFLEFQKQKDEVLSDSENILYRTQLEMNKRELHDGQYLTSEQCRELYEGGLVIELMLLPMSSLRDVARWQSNKDII